MRLKNEGARDGNPLSTAPYITKEANWLVEEFMLLANRTVARFISEAYPDRALLRCHPEPNERKLKDLETFAKEQGIHVDASSSRSLHRSLQRLKATAPDGYEVVKLLATLPMQLAKYFCTGVQDERTWGHYALAMERYTHFTSPIRRYPDVLVHRLVAAALDAGFGGRANLEHYNDQRADSKEDGGKVGKNKKGGKKKNFGPPKQAAINKAAKELGIPTTSQLQAVAEHCNERKLAAKAVQDGSLHAYLCVYLRANPAVVSGIVRAVGRKFLCVFIPLYGMEVRVPLEGQRWLSVTQKDAKDRAAAPVSVTITFDATAAHPAEAALDTAKSSSVSRSARKKAIRDTRGVRGRYLNTSEEEEAILATISGDKVSTGHHDPFGCGTPPAALPLTLRPVDRVCVMLGAKFPARKKPEVTAQLLARNPMYAL